MLLIHILIHHKHNQHWSLMVKYLISSFFLYWLLIRPPPAWSYLGLWMLSIHIHELKGRINRVHYVWMVYEHTSAVWLGLPTQGDCIPEAFGIKTFCLAVLMSRENTLHPETANVRQLFLVLINWINTQLNSKQIAVEWARLMADGHPRTTSRSETLELTDGQSTRLHLLQFHIHDHRAHWLACSDNIATWL